mmetsp:Transcript_30602/g.46961  ORF Transcript_30602/g.46961 Transcript_30602/m.46961 type:complete len:197 (+) Transcript_30602:110-700(+)
MKKQSPQNKHVLSTMLKLVSIALIQLPMRSHAFTGGAVLQRSFVPENPLTFQQMFSKPTPNSSSQFLRANHGIMTSALSFSPNSNLIHYMVNNKPSRVQREGRKMALYERKTPSDNVTGTGARGQVIFAFALAFCIWLFTIPSEFRRAYICSSSACVQNRASCSDCKTLGELRQGVAEYYRNGGGIQFDFSIEGKD